MIAATPAVSAPRIDPRLVAALAAVYVIWSSTYFAIQLAVHDIGPFMAAAIRFIAAGGVLLAIARARGAALPPPRAWLRMLPIGVLLCVGGNGFVAIAEQSVPSGGAAVVCATMPLWVGVLGAISGERPTTREWASLAVGFLGVLVLMGGPSLTGERLHVALLIGSPIMWALGSVLARRTRDVGGEHAATVGPALQMLLGGVSVLVVAVIRREPLPTAASGEAWLALAYLCVFGSLIGFTAYSWLLRNARPVVATSYAYVNPIVAVLIGAALHGEALGWSTAIANVLIVGAVMLALARRR
jgi:drug/metabolite transporter (DMT)-like permease